MLRLSTREPGFEQAFQRLVRERRESDEDVTRDVAQILAQVRSGGDDAVVELTSRFDGHTLDNEAAWRVDLAQCREAFDALKPELRAALELAADRIRTYHEAQRPEDRDYTDDAGVRLDVVTPTPKGVVNPLVLAAAHLAGVDEIWRIGGAQAIGALAYGTDRIRPVDVITGPGNAWVAEAKRQLFGVVGIDMVAGPSEILVIADAKNDPEWIAADLLSQAEHDPSSQSILITDDAPFADAVADCIGVEIAMLPTARVADQSWSKHGVIIEVESLDEAPALANALAAEHVEIATDDPETLFDRIRHAGSVFLGRHTPEAVGDYVAGPNHVLPTGRRARFASGLSVLDLMKRTSFIQMDERALAAIGPAAIALAEAEGLPAHARSIEARLGI
jgi:histidinol dehydrogenase